MDVLAANMPKLMIGAGALPFMSIFEYSIGSVAFIVMNLTF